MKAAKMRVAPLPESEWNDEVRDLLARATGARHDEPLNIFKTLARHPKLLKRWMVFGNHVLLKSTLGAFERELIILRTGWLCGSLYEWTQHVAIGRDAGITEGQIEGIKEGPEAAVWDPFQATLLRAADELHSAHVISDETWAALSERYSEQQLMDLVFAVGQYTLVSMALRTFGVQVEGDGDSATP